MRMIAHNIKTCRRSRGAAEIETLLVIPVLLMVLILSAAALDVGEWRIWNVFDAQELPYREVQTGDAGGFASDELAPIQDGLTIKNVDGNELPDKVYVQAPVAEVKILKYFQFLHMDNVKFTDKAAFVGPAWSMTSWPFGQDDQNLTEKWFTDQAEEVKGSKSFSLTPASELELAPTWEGP